MPTFTRFLYTFYFKGEVRDCVQYNWGSVTGSLSIVSALPSSSGIFDVSCLLHIWAQVTRLIEKK